MSSRNQSAQTPKTTISVDLSGATISRKNDAFATMKRKEALMRPPKESVEDAIEKVLSVAPEPMNQLQIRKALKQRYDKTTINSALYRTEKKFCQIKQASGPPLWKLREETEGPPAWAGHPEQRIFVFIDLGNVHELHEHLRNYPWVELEGFADIHYNGGQPEKTCKSTVGMPDAAQAMLIKRFNEVYIDTEGKECYIISSRDRIFSPFPHYYKNTKVITTWEDLEVEL